MKYKMIIPTTLLLVLISNSLGHAILKSEITKSEEVSNKEYDKYEINEGPETLVSFVNPKSQKPTLREIIYYHIIEKPYGSSDDSTTEPEELVVDDEPKIFTNGHSGYQFLTTDQSKDEIIGPARESAKVIETTKNAPHKDTKTVPKEDTGKVVDEDDTLDIDTRSPEKKEDTNLADSEQTSKMDTVTEVSEIKEKGEENPAKHSRRLLYDRVREKYSRKNLNKEKNNATAERRKRELRDIPEAPRLPDIDLSILPSHLQKMLSPIKPSIKPKVATESTDNKTADKIKNKMDSMFRRLKDSDENAEKVLPKTYGMDITGDRGVVWNDFLDRLGFRYDIDGIKSQEAERPKPTIVSNEDEDKEFDFEMAPATAYSKKNSIIEENPAPATAKSYGMNLRNGNGYIWNDLFGEPGLRYIEVGNSEDKNNEMINLKSGENDEETQDDDGAHFKNVPSEEQQGKSYEDEEEDIMENLLENDKFWEWLTMWTSTLMEAMEENIKTLIKDEVEKQLEEYVLRIDKNKGDDSNDKKTIEREVIEAKNKSNTSNNINKVNVSITKDITNSTDTPMNTVDIKDDKLSKNNTEPPKVSKAETSIKKNATVDNISKNEESKNQSTKDAEETSKSDVKEPKLNTNSNSKTDILRENYFELLDADIEVDSGEVNNKTPNAPIAVGAKTLIGNSVGNKKVTNIYIFYPNQEMSDIIKEMRPKNLSEIDLDQFKEPSKANNNESVKVNEDSDKDLEAKTTVSPTENNRDVLVANVTATTASTSISYEAPNDLTTPMAEISSTTAPTTEKLENISTTQSTVESSTGKVLEDNKLQDSEESKSELAVEKEGDKTKEAAKEDQKAVNVNKSTDNTVKENTEQTEEEKNVKGDNKIEDPVKANDNNSGKKVEIAISLNNEML